MNYQRTKPATKLTTKIIVGIVVALILLRLIVPNAFAALFVDAFSPLFKLFNLAGRQGFAENQIMFSADSSFASSTVAVLEQENTDMQDMLGRPTAPNAIVATVLSKPPFESYDSILVDAGSNQGIQPGDKVFALANPVVYSTKPDMPPTASSSLSSSTLLIATTTTPRVSKISLTLAATSTLSSSTDETASTSNPQIEIPIGQVAAAYGDSSLIALYSSPGQKYQVEIGSYHIAASAQADGAGMFEAMVPSNSNIAVGDPVVIPGIQTGVFASVVSIVTDPARPYSLVLFQSPVDPFSLYMVEIETTSHETK